MTNSKLMDVEFELQWKSAVAEHTDVLYALKVDPSHDILPADFEQKITQLTTGESYSKTFQAMDLLGEAYSTEKVISFSSDYFDTNFKGHYSPPILYRFYPNAIAWQGLDTTHSDYMPFRLISINDNAMAADKNHPLAKYYLTLNIRKLKQSEGSNNNKKTQRDFAKIVTSKGPGMQAPFEYGDTVFFKQYPFTTVDELRYSLPVISAQASQEIATLNSRLLPKHSKVLDVLSTNHSFLETEYKTGLLAGIGVYEEELIANTRLDTYSVQNLNDDSNLRYDTDSFNDAICSLAIETLTNPLQLMKEIARVVSSGGKFIVTFSDNKFSNEAISLWAQLHPFERIQLVLEYFRDSGLFVELNTFSKRGIADPVYAVWGTVK